MLELQTKMTCFRTEEKLSKGLYLPCAYTNISEITEPSYRIIESRLVK